MPVNVMRFISEKRTQLFGNEPCILKLNHTFYNKKSLYGLRNWVQSRKIIDMCVISVIMSVGIGGPNKSSYFIF